MNKVKTLDDLRKMRETLRSTLDIREKSNHPEQMVQIRISMATCGIAAGAKEIMNYFIEALALFRHMASSCELKKQFLTMTFLHPSGSSASLL